MEEERKEKSFAKGGSGEEHGCLCPGSEKWELEMLPFKFLFSE